jgi:hypothetical protein
MQVNDLVKVIAPGHKFEGQAGIVNSYAEGANVVKLDTVDEPQLLADDELQFLGR